jgi:signal transduction histidine kinase
VTTWLEQAAELRAELKLAMADIRRLVHEMRPPALDELGLIGALRQRVARYDAGGSAVLAGEEQEDHPSPTVTIAAPETLPDLPAAVEMTIYRIADEALVNVPRHAATRSCVVRIDAAEGSHLGLHVEDDGVGLDPHRVAGVGLLSMRERAEEMGGSFAIGPRPGSLGTHLLVRLPLPAAEETPRRMPATRFDG